MGGDELITSAEAAKIIDVSQAWVSALCRNKDLVAEKINGKWLINKQDAYRKAEERANADQNSELTAVESRIREDDEIKKITETTAKESLKDQIIRVVKRVLSGAEIAANVGTVTSLAVKVFKWLSGVFS